MTDERQALDRARALCDLGRPADAITVIAAVLGRSGDNLGAWLVLARARLMLGDDQQALRAATTAVGLAPDDPRPHALASMALSHLGRHPDAVAAAERAVTCAPDDPVWHHRLAQTLLAGKIWPRDALRAAAQAIRLAPDHGPFYVTYGTAAAACRRRRDARRSLLTALELDPLNVAARHELARLTAAGRGAYVVNLAEAVTGFAAALRLDPQHQVSRHALDQIMRVFLIRTAYTVCFAAGVALTVAQHGRPGIARCGAVTAVLLPSLVAYRFVHRLSPDLRRYLRTVATAPDHRTAALVEGFALMALLWATCVPTRWLASVLTTAVVAAVVVRARLGVHAHRHLERTRGTPVKYRFGSLTLALVAAALGLLGLVVVCFASTASTGSPVTGGVFAAGCVGASAYTIRVILVRRKRRAQSVAEA
jgi:tetratricopeptide (TPR) repeat protein